MLWTLPWIKELGRGADRNLGWSRVTEKSRRLGRVTHGRRCVKSGRETLQIWVTRQRTAFTAVSFYTPALWNPHKRTRAITTANTRLLERNRVRKLHRKQPCPLPNPSLFSSTSVRNASCLKMKYQNWMHFLIEYLPNANTILKRVSSPKNVNFCHHLFTHYFNEMEHKWRTSEDNWFLMKSERFLYSPLKAMELPLWHFKSS